MSRLPIRIRLTLVFALALAVVLSAVGAFVYFRVGASLDEQLGESLAARGSLLVESVRGEDELAAPAGDEEEFAQLIGRNGAVLSATPGFEEAALLPAGDAGHEAVEKDGARLLALPADGGRRIVVGTSLEDRDETLSELLAQLVAGGALALVLTSLGAYALAAAALGPVEAMRRHAAEISAETSGRRLPTSDRRDEVSRLGATLNAMLDRLDAGIRRERRFVADAGHELRTPLALLRTELELALRRRRSADELEAAIRSAADEVDRLARLAEDLLVLASLEEGRLPLRETTFSIDALLDTVARRFATRADASGRVLEVDAATDGTLTADRPRLEQALGNLLDNALRHGAGRIVLDATTDNGSLHLRVRDEGSGFPEDFIPHALERFSRADDARVRGGAGLGLAIVDAVARAHGGFVRVANANGGAVVAVVVPAEGHRASRA